MMRQRTIPVKEEIEVQTDVNLISAYMPATQEIIGEFDRKIVSDLFTHEGLLRPFSDEILLNGFKNTITELREAGQGHEAILRRVELLERQIYGLLKRSIMMKESRQGQPQSYYKILGEKEKQVSELEREQIYNETQIRRYRARISQLESEMANLHVSLNQFQVTCQKNRKYEDMFSSIASILKTKSTRPELTVKALEEKILPALPDFEVAIANLGKMLTRDIGPSLRSVADSYAKELDRMVKDGHFSEEKLNQSMVGLFQNLQMLKGGDFFRKQSEQAALYEQMESKYRNMLSLMRNEISRVREENPTMKSISELHELTEAIDHEGVDLIDCNGVVQIVKYETKIEERPAEDEQTRGAITLYARQFQRLLSEYPQLQERISPGFRELIGTHMMGDMVSTETLDRLRGMVVYRNDVIKVDNVYNYQNTKDKEQIFHSRVLIKALLEELNRQKAEYGFQTSLDQGILEMIRAQALENLDIEAVTSLFRPLSRVVEVPRIVQVPTFESRTYEQGVPVYCDRPVLLREHHVEVVDVNRQVPVYTDRPIDNVVTQFVPLHVTSEKALEVEVRKDVIVEKIYEKNIPQEVVVERIVSMQNVREVAVAVDVERIVEVPREVFSERIIQSNNIEYREVEKIVETQVILRETVYVPKEVEVRVDRLVEKIQYMEIEKRVPYVIKSKQIVYLERERPVIITNVIEKEVNTVEIRERLVPIKETVEVIREIPVLQDKEIIRQVAKQIFVDRAFFVKADTVENIREVEVLVERPVIREILLTKDTEVEKIVPLYITQQVVMPVEVHNPYVTERVVEVQVERIRTVPVRAEVIKEVVVEKPVPIIIEKEIIKIETQRHDNIVERIVEVPRIVEIEKIVEKIVVVPRIVQRIIEVPKIIEKIVIVERPVLQIVQIQVPMIVLQEVEIIREVFVEKEVIKYVHTVEIQERDKIVEVIVERDRPVEVMVEKRVPVQVLREVPVEIFRDRVEHQRVEIHEVRVEVIERPVPIIVQEKVLFNVEKPIITERIVERLVTEKERIQVPVTLREEIAVPHEVEVRVECPIMTEVVRDVPGVETILYVPEIKEIEMIREKAVSMPHLVQLPPKVVYLTNDKIVHDVVERVVQVPVNQAVIFEKILEVPRPINVLQYKEIPVEVIVNRDRVVSNLYEQIKEVPQVRERVVEVEVNREVMMEVQKIVKQYIREQVVREIEVNIPVREIVYQEVTVPAQQVIQQVNEVHKTVEVQERLVEKIYEKIVMMPQIVEVVKNIHHVTERNSLDRAVNVDQTAYLEQLVGVGSSLKGGLQELLANLRKNVARQPELRIIIDLIEKNLRFVNGWIDFPKVVEVVKEVEKEVDKERVVLVPTENKDKIAVLSFMVEKCVGELKRLRDAYKVNLNIDEDLLRIFFNDRKDLPLDSKFHELAEGLRQKYSSFSSWSESCPFMLNYFLEEHFSLRGIIEQSNRLCALSQSESAFLRNQMQKIRNRHQQELCNNRLLYGNYTQLILLFRKYCGEMGGDDVQEALRRFEQFVGGMSQEELLFSLERQRVQQTSSILIGEKDMAEQPTLSMINGNESRLQESAIHIERLARTEMKNSQLARTVAWLENQNAALKENIMSQKNTLERTQFQLSHAKASVQGNQIGQDQSIIHGSFNQGTLMQGGQFGGVQGSSQQTVSQSVSPQQTVSQSVSQQNMQNKAADTLELRNLAEKIRALERENEAEKKNSERLRTENQNMVERGRKDIQQEAQRKERELKEAVERVRRESERELSRVKIEVDRVVREKERYEGELTETKRRHLEEINSLKSAQSRMSQTAQSQMNTQLIQVKNRVGELEMQVQNERAKQNTSSTASAMEINQLKRRVTELDVELQNEKRKASVTQPSQDAQLKKTIAELEVKLQNERSQNNALQLSQQNVAETNQLRRRIGQLQIEVQNERNKKMVGGSGNEASQLRSKIAQLQLQGEKTRRSLVAAQQLSQQSSLQGATESSMLRARISELQTEIQSRKVNAGEANAQQSQLYQQSIIEITQLKNIITELNTQIQTQKRSYLNSVSSEDFQRQISENSQLKSRIVELEMEIARLSAASSSLQNDRESTRLKGELEKLQQEKLRLEAITQRGQGDTTDWRYRYEQIERDYRELKNRMSSIDESLEMRGLRDRLRRMEIQLETKTRQNQMFSKPTNNFDMRHSVDAREHQMTRNNYRGSSPPFVRSVHEEESSSSYEHVSTYRSEMSMREFIGEINNEQREIFAIMLMIKLIEKVENESKRNPSYAFPSYTPINIHISNFNPQALESITVQFGAPIIPGQDEMDDLYLAPEVLNNEAPTRKSSVFNLGIILDELINGELYFRTIEDITNPAIEFRARLERLNPILKNCLFEIMSKEPTRRLELGEAKRRFHLLSYIASENTASLTATRSPSQRARNDY